MSIYETIVIYTMKRKDTRTLKENIDEMKEALDLSTSRYDKKITLDELGEKKLAYEIKGEKTGYYVVFTWAGNEEDVATAERLLRMNDNVLKFITVKTDKDAEDLEEYAAADHESEQDDPAKEIPNALDIMLGLAKYNN